MMIANKYEIICKIGSGSFGTIYKGKNIRLDEEVAIKVEPIKNQTKLLKNESIIYQYLAGCQGIPQIKWFGLDGTNYYMVINLLGNSLLNVKEKCNTFPLTVIKSVGKQIIEILRVIHEKGLLHRDIKPDNFLLGLNDKKNNVYIIDFGFCKKYVTSHGKHIEMKQPVKFLGTPNFASLNMHNLLEPSRRDDLESLGYMIVYFYYGYFAWATEKNETVKRMKENMEKYYDLPDFLVRYFDYVRGLDFEETPDYDRLIEVIENA